MHDLYLPDGRDDDLRRFVLQEAWDCTDLSNCEDKKLGAVLLKEGAIIGRGYNLCAPMPHNHGDLLASCPRKNAKRGTLRSVCRGFHAEVFSCLSATKRGVKDSDYLRFCWHRFSGKKGEITKRVLKKLFTEEDREYIQGATLYLVGVAYVCDVCSWFLDWLGVIVPEENIIPGRPEAAAEFELRRTFDPPKSP